jgi:hypothetical protein
VDIADQSSTDFNQPVRPFAGDRPTAITLGLTNEWNNLQSQRACTIGGFLLRRGGLDAKKMRQHRQQKLIIGDSRFSMTPERVGDLYHP